MLRTRKKMIKYKEYGFEIKIVKPIEDYTDEELEDFNQDIDLLEREVDMLKKILDDETKRRGCYFDI